MRSFTSVNMLEAVFSVLCIVSTSPMQRSQAPAVLTIAGSDSGGGAGIQADLKTFAAHGIFGTSVITALTAQNTRGVQGVWEVPAHFVAQQLDAVLDDFDVRAIKIGMLANSELVLTVAHALKASAVPKGIAVVLDPVMVATSGDVLLQPEAIEVLKKELMPLANLITPNLHETELLTGLTMRTESDLMLAAKKLLAFVQHGSVLVKGGHLAQALSTPTAIDILLGQDLYERFEQQYLPGRSMHGTGCTLSSAIAARLALGHKLRDAVALALRYVHAAIAAATVEVGQGHRPLQHTLVLPE